MQHTVHMFIKLDYHVYSALFRVLLEMSRSSCSKFYLEGDRSYHCHLLKEKGLILILRYTEFEGEISYCALEIIMNPMRLIIEDEYLQLATMKHSKAIYSAFTKAFNLIKKKFESNRLNKNLKFKLHQLDSYSYKRIDFANNFYTEHIKLYMKLIKRANIPNGFQQFLKYKESSKRYEPTEHSFYLFRRSNSKSKSNRTTLTINCYDKGEQMKENNLPCEDERVEHTIRFEVQCYYNKVYRIIKSKNLCKQGYSQFLHGDISEDVLLNYFKKSVGLGDYYTLSKAKETVLSTRINQETKRGLIETLVLINDKRGVWKAKETVSDKEEFNKRIKKLNELGINPVTIPVAEGIDYLPSLFDM
jgi:hypothetical protein